MNWEMTLLVERNKGRTEGEIEGISKGETLKLIRLVLAKALRGQSAEVIAEDLVEDPAVIKTIIGIASSMRNPTAEEVYESYVKIHRE